MSHTTEPGEELVLTPEQLQGLSRGVAATIMPVSGGWRVHYFSIPDFENEPGDDFPTFEDALAAVSGVLPALNTEEERQRAAAEYREQLPSSDDAPL